jgi:transposase
VPRKFTNPYPPEFRAEARLVREGGRSVNVAAKDLGISNESLRNWLKQADLDSGRRKDGLTSEERQELVRLRRENRNQREDKEILKKPRSSSRRRPARAGSGLRVHRATEDQPPTPPDVPAAGRLPPAASTPGRSDRPASGGPRTSGFASSSWPSTSVLAGPTECPGSGPS